MRNGYGFIGALIFLMVVAGSVGWAVGSVLVWLSHFVHISFG